MTVSPRDADVTLVRDALHGFSPSEESVIPLTADDLEAIAALDRLEARVHALERATSQAQRALQSYVDRDLGTVTYPGMFYESDVERLKNAESALRALIFARAVVLEGAARQEQDLGAPAPQARGTDAIPSTEGAG